VTSSGRVRWLGHSTVLLEVDGVRLLTDPVLRPRVLHLRRAAPLVDEDLLELDAVLISHLHYDHLDLPSLQRIERGVTVVVPKSVDEVQAGDSRSLGGAVVRAVRAEHGSSRVLGAKSDALGYVVEGSLSIYFPGDTDLFPDMTSLAPALDLALMPIWGWGPSPIHWGTYYPVQSTRWKTPAFLSTPVQEFERWAAELAPDVEVRVLQVGEELLL
jgi:L-ascorbate metabolism protein UlaG (beta-lactamase superfamily)